MGHVLKPHSPIEQLLYTTVRITAWNRDRESWFGTGFFYQTMVEGGLNAPFLVTNRHVLEGATEIRIITHRCTEGEDQPSGYYNGTNVNIAPGTVHFHPDLNVDLAVLPVAELLDHWASQGRTIFYKALTPSLVPDEKGWADFDALEDLLMIGCPNGLFDQENHFAIIRKGITASPLSVPYEGKQEFLADIACFGGSSGSPIFSYNPGISFDRNTSQYSLTGRGLRFVGVLYAGPVYLQEEQVVLRTPVVNISTPMHLGFAIRSSEVKRMVHDLLIARGSTPAVQAV